jgi:hypothetical protein
LQTSRSPSEAQKSFPPEWLEFVVGLVAARRQRNELLGCLEERFHENVRLHGYDRALSRYRSEALDTILRLVWPKLKRLGLFGLVVSAVRRLFG